MIPKDKAIAALSEINKLRHEWNERMSYYNELTQKDEIVKTVYHVCKKELTSAIERAYEILNSD